MKPVAFVQACWHRELVDLCRDGFVEALRDVDPEREVELFEVPGSFELPLHAQLLACSGRHDAVVAAGAVVGWATAGALVGAEAAGPPQPVITMASARNKAIREPAVKRLLRCMGTSLKVS